MKPCRSGPLWAGLFLCLAIGTICAQPVEAQQNEDTTPTLIITANRYPTDPKNVGSAVTVIPSEKIEELKVKTVDDALRTVPGVSVVQTGHRGGVSSVFMRGSEADQVLVLVDGVRLNESTTGGFDFSDLSVDNIDRIEVLRGPQGTLYGSEAIGGVIQIFSKKPLDGKRVGVGLEAGSFGTHRESLRAAYGDSLVSTSTEASWEQTDGISAAAKNRGNPEEDGFDQFSIGSSNSFRPNDEWELTAGAGYQRSHADIDGFDFTAGAVDDPNYRQLRDRLRLNAGASGQVGTMVRPSVQVAYVDEKLEGTDPDTEFNPFEITSELLSVTSQADLAFTATEVLTLGHAYEQRSGENKGSFDEQRDVNALFLQQQGKVAFFNLSAGARYEHDSRFGEEVTYRLTSAVPIEASGSRLHSSYGTGFKAPSFNELAFPDFGNPDLDPETSWGYDVGVEQQFSEKFSGDVTFFYSSYDDLIGFDTETFIAENISEARAYGLETQLTATPCEFVSSTLTYTYTDSENKETGALLPRRPRHQAGLTTRLTPVGTVVEPLDVTLRLLLVNSREDSDGSKMDNYATVDATLRYAVSNAIKPYIRFVNLFDEDYEELPSYGTPGFSVYAGIDLEAF